ncbi:MAG TPA: DUF4157 domain-containing protein, partial [Steroidobacteraceae bacterium]|nr:DUF4157 domain-containing protein [Steroidobacteraceae bacterium]
MSERFSHDFVPAPASFRHAEMSAAVSAVLKSPGKPLDQATRSHMEPRFGSDFSQVRIHTDDAAARSAHELTAAAYTVGAHIAFARDAHAPGTAAGDE